MLMECDRAGEVRGGGDVRTSEKGRYTDDAIGRLKEDRYLPKY
jgi:hypothetical protein